MPTLSAAASTSELARRPDRGGEAWAGAASWLPGSGWLIDGG